MSVSSARLEVSTADCGIELSDLSYINCASLWRSMAMIDLKLNLIRHGRLLGSKSIFLINLIQFHPGRSLLVVARREWNVWKESGFQLGRVSLTYRNGTFSRIDAVRDRDMVPQDKPGGARKRGS